MAATTRARTSGPSARDLAALDRFASELDAGRRPDVSRFLANLPQAGRSLRDALHGMLFVATAFPRGSRVSGRKRRS